jgi:hypothetical protein
VYTWFTYAKFKDIASFRRANGEKEYEILKFWTYYETAKFKKDQSDKLGKLKLGEFRNKGTRFAYCRERHTSFRLSQG